MYHVYFWITLPLAPSSYGNEKSACACVELGWVSNPTPCSLLLPRSVIPAQDSDTVRRSSGRCTPGSHYSFGNLGTRCVNWIGGGGGGYRSALLCGESSQDVSTAFILVVALLTFPSMVEMTIRQLCGTVSKQIGGSTCNVQRNGYYPAFFSFVAWPELSTSFSIKLLLYFAKMDSPSSLSSDDDDNVGHLYPRPAQVDLCYRAACEGNLGAVKEQARQLLHNYQTAPFEEQPHPAWLYRSLSQAIQQDNIQMVKFLLAENVANGNLPVEVAVRSRAFGVLELFLRYGLDINQPLRRNEPPVLGYDSNLLSLIFTNSRSASQCVQMIWKW